KVVTDLNADPPERRLVDGKLVARNDEAVDPEKRQVRLPVAPDQPIRPDENCGVVEDVPVALEQAAHGVDVEPSARVCQCLRARPRNLLRVRQRFVAALEHVARESALGEDEELYAGRGRLLEAR